MNIPEPMIPPITIIVASNRPNLRASPGGSFPGAAEPGRERSIVLRVGSIRFRIQGSGFRVRRLKVSGGPDTGEPGTTNSEPGTIICWDASAYEAVRAYAFAISYWERLLLQTG